jgi:hypothetical protein
MCACSILAVFAACVIAVLGVTISVMRVQQPSVRAWSTCPSCRHWSMLCARLCARGRGVCLQETRGHGLRVRWNCCVCGLCLCSLEYNGIGDAGAAAIGAGLVHVPQLQALVYVVCPAVCAGLRCVLASFLGATACELAVCTVCVIAALPRTISVRRCRRCGGRWCRPGALAPAAGTEVRCVLGSVSGPGRMLVWKRGMMARVRAGVVVCTVCVIAALPRTISVPQVRRPLVQAWCTCPSCRH